MSRSRRLRRDQGPTVSLFPFLAVLLCTMGMLIMLLVLIGRDTAGQGSAERAAEPDPLFSSGEFESFETQTAELKPETHPAPEASSVSEPKRLSPDDEQLYEEYLRLYGEMDPDEIERQRESAEWFLSELEGVRDRTRDELTALRAKLSEAEAEIAKQVAQLIELNEQALALSGKEGSESDSETLQAEIDAKVQEISSLNEEIGQLRQKAEDAGKKPAYAILPYRGKSGTFRRPIYVECDGNGIRLMPERVQFLPEDFLVAKYPGNPFDAGLRAARQYYVEKGEGNAENEPYPLLILKPESAQQYYIAKAALASWGGEFGYEFVESDSEIEYPRPDPELKRRVEEQVAMARSRLAGPIAALLNEIESQGMNAQFEDEDAGGDGGSESGGGSGLASRLGPYAKLESGIEGESGGFGEAALSDIPDFDRGYRSAPAQGGYAGSAPAGFGGAARELAGAESIGGELAGEEHIGAESAGGGLAGGNFAGAEPSEPADSLPEAGSLPVPGISGEDEGTETAAEGGTYVQGAQPYSVPGSGAAVTPFAEMTPKAEGEEDNEGPGIDPRETVGNTAFLSGTQGDKTGSPEGADLSAARGKADPKEEKEPKVKAQRDKRAINLAEELKKPSQTAIERPVSIVCGAGGLTFPAQPGIRDAKEISFSGGEDEQEVLETVIACVRAWKAAGRNMYWSPWIRVKVAPGGEAAYQRLARLMDSQKVRVEQVR